MQERKLIAKLSKIKSVLTNRANFKKKLDEERDSLFSSVLSELDQEYDHLISLVRVAKYELIFNELLEEEDGEENNGFCRQ